jgi:TolB-like protein
MVPLPKSRDTAVTCAVAIQEKMVERVASGTEPRIRFRIGINVGDVIIDGDDIFGDGVNVAARVENECEPGGVYVSGNAFEQIRGKAKFLFDDLGDRTLKNIERPVRLYAVRAATTAPTAVMLSDISKPLPLPDKPSIAVLPFQNMSGDPEQEYFADGIVEDIITALSRFKSLFVIARNSSFTYKGKATDIKQVGRELGVRYVLEGSVRKAGTRVRITGQLIEASTGTHLWADRFDGALEDVVDLQDRVTKNVVAAIAPRLEQAEIERAARKPTQNLDARDCYNRGVDRFRLITPQANAEARQLFRRAIELDPNFAAAYGQLAGCYRQWKLEGWPCDDVELRAEGRQFAARAIALGQDDAVALSCAAHFFGYVLHELETADALANQALHVNSNLFRAWQVRGLVSLWLGKHEEAIEQLAQGMRLNPVDPDMYISESAMAWPHLFLGRFEEALTWATRALSRQPNLVPSLRVATIANAKLGRLDEARKMLERLQGKGIPLTRLPFRREQDVALYMEGMRLLGLSD